MPEPTDSTVIVRGRNLAVRVWGQSTSPPVLALHGWLDNAVSFDALAPLLPELHIVAVDLPGHGLSDHHPPTVPYHYVDWVTDVTAIADALGWDRFSLMGHSMGAGIACLFAGTFPARVERLVLLDGLGPMTAEATDAPERLAAGVRRLLSSEGREGKPLADRDAAAKKMSEVVPGLTMAGARRLLGRGMKEVPGGVVWRADPRLRVPSLFRLTQEQVHAFLRRIACPVLLVWGQNSYRVERDWVQGQLDCLRNVKVVGLPGGHHVHLDDAGAVAPHVREHFSLVP